ncbi:MAG: hypothetical protein KA118_18255 [Verrucomicrobia bacterium]|jgi:hypothetical protein|nr:hypothetical protein [Verrucomicrobiota bacterium]
MTQTQTLLFIDAYRSIDNDARRAADAAAYADLDGDDDLIVRAGLSAAQGQQSPAVVEALRSNDLNLLIRGY